MRLPWRKEKKSSTFLTLDGPTTVHAGQPPFALPLVRAGNEAEARQSSAVMSIVNWAVTNCAEPLLKVYKRNGDEWEVDAKNPANEIIRRPDPENNKRNHRWLNQVAFESLTLMGESFYYKLRGQGSGRVVGLIPIRAASVAPVAEGGMLTGYRITLSGGRMMTVPPEDVVHVMDGQDPANEFRGRSRLKELGMAVGTDISVMAYIYALVKSPAPSYAINPKNPEDEFQDTQAQDLKEGFTSMASGNRAGSAIVSTLPIDVQRIGFSPDEMMIDEIKAYVDANAASVLGLPAMVVGLQIGLERSTFSNYAEARTAAVEDFLIPKWSMIAAAMTEQLGPDFWGDSQDYEFRYDLSEIRALQDDEDALTERMVKLFTASAIDRATLKRELGMKPLPEDEGVYFWMLKGTDMQSLMAGVVAGKRNDVPG
jgi:HK97 family phage portal protein